MSKRTIFLTYHIVFYLLIALSVISLVFLIWYPLPLANAVGVTHIFILLLAIDVIVGPILGFVVFKEGKKSLKFDLSVIIFIQISALIYGIFTIEQGRPVWVVFNSDRFELIRKNEIIIENNEEIKSKFQRPSWFGPQYVAVEVPSNIQQQNSDLLIELLGRISIAQKPERYVPLEKVKNQIQQSAQNLNVLNQFNDEALVKKTLSKYPQATAFLPLKANAVDMTVLINREKGEVVKIVDLRPWK